MFCQPYLSCLSGLLSQVVEDKIFSELMDYLIDRISASETVRFDEQEEDMNRESGKFLGSHFSSVP